ncbi:radical SAM protein [Legionella parisiensis]|uniref:Coenzyme PQQ synthesis protein E n=1 Tax=Legionella parisiensis TaxID=45071 RepID=A0A1E5JNC7_9GAMM|nr:radical SAM protein [Legionella parisiensis]KTD44256.1 pyrroloquinoline quinone biosynthesis protein PqqE [Legionella parisiensis]OEH46046.1 Coenzyme PQQ synthesis protein E [Legionella parisiensis]STX71881.1 pyrroloquinoline quinone biosynthesis protein PqqE [Legionella parisiensis]
MTINHNTDEILPFSFGNLSTSNYLWLTLTNLCNLHCKYCFNYISHCNEHMSADLSVNIVKSQLLSLDKNKSEKFFVTYFGGEPTLNHAALMSSVHFLIDNDVNCRQCLMTNGVFNSRTFTDLINKDIEFQVSFDGKNNNLRFNKNLTKAVFTETLETIKKLTSNKESVCIRATIHQDNVKNLPSLVQLCDAYGVRRLQIAPICNFGDAEANAVQQPDLNEYFELFCKAFELSLQYNVHIDLHGEKYFNHIKNQKMKIPFVWLPDGYVAMSITYASSRIKGAEKIIIGKFNEVENRIDLNNSLIDQMKHNFLKNRKKYCHDCPIRDLCCGNIHFTPFATDTFNPKRDRYFCELAIRTVKEFRE